MRNSPPQAALWTDGHRSAPSLAVFDAVSRTGGLGASSSVALALSQGPLASGRIPLPDIQFSRNRMEISNLAILPVQSKLGQDAVQHLKILPIQCLPQSK